MMEPPRRAIGIYLFHDTVRCFFNPSFKYKTWQLLISVYGALE